MVDLHQELVGGIALLRGRNKISAGIGKVGIRIQLEKLRTDGIHSDGDGVSIGIDEVAGPLIECRNVGDAGDTSLPPKALIVQKKESAVLHNRAAQRASKLVQMQARFGERCLVKEVAGVEHIVAEEFIHRSMQLVGARLGDQVDHGAGVAPIFRGERVGLNFELLNGID